MMRRFWCAAFATAVALILCGSVTFAEGNTTSVCENPTFRTPAASPFPLFPKAGLLGEPKAVAAGNFFKKSGADAGCGCDLAVALATDDGGFVALLRGNEDGSFFQKNVFALPAGEIPVAIAKGRFKIEGSGGLDSVAVATLKPAALGEPGHVRVFAPDENGAYVELPSARVADQVPIAMTVGDFDGDGRLDLAVANKTRSKLTILLGAGTGLLSEPITVDLNPNILNSVATVRSSGAGGPDGVAVGTLTPDQSDPAARRVAVVVVRRNASGSFLAGPPLILGAKNSLQPWVAAANLTLPDSSAQRPGRDLAVAYVDRDAGSNPIARVKVLLGQDTGGFAVAQTHDLGAAITRSATVADLDDDGVPDLIVSTYGFTESEPDGTVRFFQGKTGASAGFHANASWFSIPSNTGIRPQSLAAGRFGPKIQSPSGPRANIGLVAANAPGLKTVSVFLGNGRGTFVQPTVVSTRLPKTADLFITGDFHSASGADPLQDLAYVSDGGAGRVLSILFSNGAGGFVKPDNAVAIPIGAGPHLEVSGNFDISPPTDIVVLNTSLDPAGGGPLLTLLTGKGDGRFVESEFFPLDPGEQPVALVAGRFSDQAEHEPLDLALVSKNRKMTLLVNDKHGRFPKAERRSTTLPFTPAAIAVSDNLRGDGRNDLVIRDADARRFVLLQNLGHVDAGESQFKFGGFFGETSRDPNFLVGQILGNGTADQLNHIVTFDSQEIRAFKANEFSGFDPVRVSSTSAGTFSPTPPYTIADFGDGKPGLAVAATNDGGLGVIQMKGDGRGGFTFANGYLTSEVDPGDALEAKETTDFTQSTLPPFGLKSERTIVAAIANQFRSSLHGNNKPDVAFVSKLALTGVGGGKCPNDPKPTPESKPERHVQSCHFEEPEPDEPCCHPFGHCQNCPKHKVCETIVIPAEPPFQPFCTTTQGFAPVITVFANTCGD